MEHVLPYILLILGFAALVKGGDFFVDGSSSIAKKLRIPDIIVGLTIVAMGTSAPELAVSVSAALSGSADISLGNVVGSSILNILVILGLSIVILPMVIDTSIFRRDFPVLIISAVLLPILTFFGGYKLGLVAGVILLLLFAVYLFLTVKSALDYRKTHADESAEEIRTYPWWKSILFTLLGAALIIIGGKVSVNAATDIARQLGLSEAVIGLTVVALGTSLPELVTSVVAAKKGNSDIALGNIIGSNIFNVLLILGVTVLIRPITADLLTLIDQLVLLVVTALLFIFSATGKKLYRIEGVLFLLLYGGYTAYLFLR